MRRINLYLVIVSGLIVIALITCGLVIELPVKGNTYRYSENLLTNWESDLGSNISLKESINDINTTHTFKRKISGKDLNSSNICMISHNLVFSVYLDGEMIYDFYPELGGIYGKRYGEAVHTINLPSFTDTRTLTIEAYSLRENASSGFNEVKLMNSREFIHLLAQKYALKLSFCIITFFFGVLLFIIGIIEDQMRGQMLEAVCLGAITFIVSAWIGSQTMLMRILVPNPAMMRIMEYMTLDVLPIPVLLFTVNYTNTHHNKFVIANIILSALNTVASILLVVIGVIDYSDLLIITHLLIASGVALIIYMVVRAIRKKEISRKMSIYIVTAMSFLVISGMFDMIRYYINSNGNLASLTVVGLFAFALILAIYEYNRIIEMQVMSSKTEIMQTLAMEDALTKLGSRAAFVAYEKQIMERNSGTCLFVHFDVNNLKRVNDVFGHAEGDKHLIAAAKVLKDSFGEHGKVFRVGGDEFFAILDESTCHDDYEKGLPLMIKAQEDYNASENPPVALAIAHGMAEYDCSTHNPETAEKIADSRMYEEKRRMKALAAT